MRQRAPLVLSATALVVAVFGSTPVGRAVTSKIPAFAKTSGFAKVAGNSAKLNGRRSTLSGAPGTIPVVGKDGKLPAGLGTVGARGPQGERGPQGPAGPAGGGTGGGGRPNGPAGGGLTGSYPNPVLAPGSVGASQVIDNSLTGADVNESTLAQVPAALVGGLGRSFSNHAQGTPDCDPESPAFGTCVDLAVDLPVRARVLLLGRISAFGEPNKFPVGICRLATSVNGPLPGTAVTFAGQSDRESGSLIGVTPPLGPGPVTVRIDCNETVSNSSNGIRYVESAITAVALSPS